MFFRGINAGLGIMPQKGKYSGMDVVIEKGKWIKEKIIFDVAQSLEQENIILKGANAIDSERKFAGIQIAGIQIANPTIGTSGPIFQAVIGSRAQLIIPVGFEKRVFGSISEIAAKLNEPSSTGLRMLPVSGTIITELEAIRILTGSSQNLWQLDVYVGQRAVTEFQ